jgi:hypothetical protein
MRISFIPLATLLFATVVIPSAARAQDQRSDVAKLTAAKTAFFDDQSEDSAVGGAALAELKKWGRFQLVQQQSQADVIILLSIDPYHSGSAIMANGKMGVVDDNGNVVEAPVTEHKKSGSSRDAYLTVVDPKTNDPLWSDSRIWGGLLTGENSAGERLVKSLEKAVGK